MQMTQMGDDTESLRQFQSASKFGNFDVQPNEESKDLFAKDESSGPKEPSRPTSFQFDGPAGDESAERQNLLNRLSRLSMENKLGSITFSEHDTIEKLRRVNTMATHAGRARLSIKTMKRVILFVATGLEQLCIRFPNKFVDLEGYGSYLKGEIDSYTEILHEVYEFYSEAFAALSPVVTLVMALGSNMAMYSIHRKMLKATAAVDHENLGKRAPPPAEGEAEEFSGEEDSEEEGSEEDPIDNLRNIIDSSSFATYMPKAGDEFGLVSNEEENDVKGATEIQEEQSPSPNIANIRETAEAGRKGAEEEVSEVMRLDLDDSSSVSSAN